MTDIPARLASTLADRYTLERTLGEGGMATVYLADDLKHNRKVAIKVLKPELAAVLGGERFLTEIQTTANLQHPHILPLFDSGEADHFLYYVMPYVEGESLRDRLDRDKQLPVDEALHIAKAVASALDYAHRRDVIHRDIKPANILLHDGQPVIADFGIAIAVSAAGGGRVTETGLSLGTPHYMSPEQASADRDLTGKSDIYALGCTTYEMLAGTPPFSGHNAQSILMQILTEEARSVTSHRKTVPSHVASAIARALEKLPADRFESADAFAKALDDPGFTHASVSAATNSPSATAWSRDVRTVTLAVTAIVAVLYAGMSSATSRTSNVTNEPVRFTETLPSHVSVGDDFFSSQIAVDPAGQNIYLVSREDDRPVWRRNLATGEYTEVPGVRGVRGVDVSPDGATLLLFVGRAGEIMTTPVTGGAPRSLNVGATAGSGLWGSDDWIYYRGADGATWRIRPTGGQAERVGAVVEPTLSTVADFGGDAEFEVPRASIPGSEAVLFSVQPPPDFDTSNLGIIREPGDTMEILVRGMDPFGFLDEGYIVGSSDEGAALAVPFDTRRLITTGPPTTLPLSINGSSRAAVSSALAVFLKGSTHLEHRLVMITREGVETPLSVPVGEYLFPRFSPDGTRLAMEIHDDLGGQIWMLEMGSGALNVLTSEGHNTRPLWFPDGSRILFSRGTGFYSVRADGGGDEQLVWAGNVGYTDSAWLPNGRLLFGQTAESNSGVRHNDLVTIQPGVAADPQPFIATPADETAPAVSPDGNWVAYTSDASGEARLFVTPSSGTGGRFAVSTGEATNISWGSTGYELLYQESDGFYSALLNFDPDFSVTRQRLFAAARFVDFSTSAAYAVKPNSSDILFVQSPDGAGQEFTIMTNFGEQVRRWIEGGGG